MKEASLQTSPPPPHPPFHLVTKGKLLFDRTPDKSRTVGEEASSTCSDNSEQTFFSDDTDGKFLKFIVIFIGFVSAAVVVSLLDT